MNVAVRGDGFYRDKVLDHALRPRNYGRLNDADLAHEEHNLLCGDTIGLDLRVTGDRIVDVRFHGQGCAVSLAAASMFTERLRGLRVAEGLALSDEDMLADLEVELPLSRRSCALLSRKALRAAVLGAGSEEEDDGAGYLPSRRTVGSTTKEGIAVRDLHVDEVWPLIQSGEYEVIDVREAWEHAAGHIPGARHVALAAILADPASLAFRDKTIFACEVGRHSAVASETAAALGVRDVVNVRGGHRAWREARLPEET
jgi:nitrogen fixation protein NifU and related proteins